MRKQGLIYLFTLAVWVLWWIEPSFSATVADRPNIIFILADDLGYGDVGFNGQEFIRTPRLDRLAEEGIVFTQHYAGSTVCMPSRCCLLTGKHTGHATVRGNPRQTAIGKPVNIGPDDVTVAEELSRAGYRTAIIGKWGLAEGGDDQGLPTRNGFDFFYGYRNHGDAHHYYPKKLWRNEQPFELAGNNTKKKRGKYSHDLVSSEALKWIESSCKQPFFLYLAYTIPHLELTVPADSKRPYEKLHWPRRKMYDGHYHNDPEGNVTYAGMISRMDRDIGRLVDLLQQQGITENTLVIFSSDNGPEYERKDRFFNSNGDLRGGKRDLYEGGIRVPMVAWWPGQIKPGTRSDHLSAFWDFLPTACEAAGIAPTDDEIDGISYLPTLLGETDRQQQHDYLYWEFKEQEGSIQAIRKDNWKAIRRFTKPLRLFDLSSDFEEFSDVAADYPKIASQMKELFKTARSENAAFPLVPHGKRAKAGK